ncbi:MAG: hypothetical protein CMB96_01330 [Flavobacteriaceae bacterium]|nr:hypothetical protein [Flavobacteriaceae bacterium]
MNAKFFFLIVTVFAFSCSNESVDSLPENNASDFFPNNVNSYWKYVVDSNSEDLPDMNFAALDSVYVAESSDNSISLAANNDALANGRMNMILTSGNLYKTDNTLALDGSIDLTENLADLGFADSFTLTGLTLYDLEASNESIMFTENGTSSNSIPIQDTEVPVDINFEIQTKKINFYDSKTINQINYNNVFEGELTLSLEINATISLLGFPQTVTFLDPQDILSINYYFAESIGMVNAQASQGFALSDELTTLLTLANIPLEIPTSINISSSEVLSDYALE